MRVIENPTGETVLLYARHDIEESPTFGLVEIQVCEGMIELLREVSRAVVGSGLDTGSKSVLGEALASMRLVLEDEGSGVRVFAEGQQLEVAHAIVYSDGSVQFDMTVSIGRGEYTFISDNFDAETIARLVRGEGISPGDLEDAEDLYFSGDCFRHEAIELYEEMAPEIEEWPEPVGSAA